MGRGLTYTADSPRTANIGHTASISPEAATYTGWVVGKTWSGVKVMAPKGLKAGKFLARRSDRGLLCSVLRELAGLGTAPTHTAGSALATLSAAAYPRLRRFITMFQRSWRNVFLALVGWLVAGFIVVKITDALTHGTHWWIYIPFAVIGLASAVIHVATARSSSSDSR